MDFILTQGYRVVFDDLVLINDVAWAYYPISRSKKENLRGYLHGLTKSLLIVVQKEREEIETDQIEQRGYSAARSPSIVKKLSAELNDRSDKAKVVVIREVLWEFMRSVVIPLTVEELSQYPFWAAKVIMVASGSHTFVSFGDTFRFWLLTLYNNFKTTNATNIFIGSNIPYLGAAIVSNNENVARVLKNYFNAALKMIPKSLSQSSSYDLFRKTAVATNKTVQTKQRKSDNNSNKSNNSKDDDDHDDDAQASPSSRMANKIISVTVAQPMLVLAIDMLTNRTLAGVNWLNSTVQVLRYKGHMGFLRGFRASMIFTVLPLSPIYLCGLSETIIYRCISGYGRSNSDQSGGVLSVTQHMLEAEGSRSLLQYGYISALQIIPGFLALVAARSLVWLALGSTKHRMHALDRRKQIVKSIWK